ncbi:MAG: AMP-binding protein, partial [Azoarcus sp.]|nr:AMP-binding protein [Azoarcus sp.]
MKDDTKVAVQNESLVAFDTLVDMLRQRAEISPAKLAYEFINNDGTIDSCTYAELDARACAIGRVLQRHVARDRRALLLYSTNQDFLSAFFGCLYAGIVAVPMPPLKKNRRINRFRAVLCDTQASIVLTTAKEAATGNIQEASQEDKVAVIATDTIAAQKAYTWEVPPADGDSIAFLQYTSGSTGMPKGVINRHDNILCNLQMIADACKIDESSRTVSWLPYYHDMGLIGAMLVPMYVGTPCRLMSPEAFVKDPAVWLKHISDSKATYSVGPSFAYDLCVRAISESELKQLDLSSWKIAFNGAEPVKAEAMERFAEKFAQCGFRKETFYPCYGMAEAALIISGGPPNRLPVINMLDASALQHRHVRIATASDASTTVKQVVGCGHPVNGAEIVIVDPDTRRRCPDNHVGEIWVSAPSIAAGYWNQAELTHETFHARLDGSERNFLRTGDLGYLRDNELFWTGRLKDLLIIRGRNIYPQDVESVAESSHPMLRSNGAAAFPMEGEDGSGERLAVACEIERKYMRKLDATAVVKAIRKSIVDEFEISPGAIVLVKPGGLPRTSSGKLRRSECSQLFAQQRFDALHVDQGQELEAALAQIWREVLGTDTADRQDNFFDLGGDSLLAAQLVSRLRQLLDVEVPLREVFAQPSLAALSQVVSRAVASSQPEMERADRTKPLPASLAQRRLWFLEQLGGLGSAYHIAGAVLLRGELDVQALQASLD